MYLFRLNGANPLLARALPSLYLLTFVKSIFLRGVKNAL